jgi:alcohol dehydrogenase class IV
VSLRFEFATAAEIVFGAGTRGLLAERARRLGRAALVVTGRDGSRAAPLVAGLQQAGVTCTLWHSGGEPTIAAAVGATERARLAEAEVVVTIGGGSAIDLGKAVAALLTNPGDPLDYVEVVGRGQPLTRVSAPHVAVPTTAGTGTEVTRNAVLAAEAHGMKVSMRSPLMLPTLAIVDPDLTVDLPPALTASTGMDALTQLIEPYLSVRANPITDGFCTEGIVRVARSLRRAVTHGGDPDARTDMALASLLGGLSLANAGLGAVHGFAAPIGGRFAAPHGAVCAALLPIVMRVNLAALRRRQPESPTLARFTTVARLLTASPTASADEGIAWLEALRADLDIPRLSHYGVTEGHASDLAEAASRASSMRGNCIVLGTEELHEVIARAL